MRLHVVLTIIVLAVGLLPGQDKPAPAPQEALEAAIIPVRTLSGDSFNRLARLLDVFKAKYTYDDRLRTILVYAPKDVVAQMRRVVEELDRPGSEAAIGRNIEMTLAFLRCSTKAPEAASALPADLEPVARQLRAVTQYKDIQLWDTVPLHLQEGKETTQDLRLPGRLPEISGSFTMAHIQIHTESVGRRDSGRYVRFSRLSIRFRIPYSISTGNFQFMDAGLNTAGDFKEGQKTVVGKVSGSEDESAIFAVISLKVLD